MRICYDYIIRNTANSRCMDKLAENAGENIYALMCRAALVCADICTSIYGDTKENILVVCGPGNNGGDGYVIARILKDRGYKVSLCAIVPPDISESINDTAFGRAVKDWMLSAGIVSIPVFKSEILNGTAYVIDAVFGIGLSRDTPRIFVELTESLLKSSAHVISVDIPSGIDANTGQVRGAAIKADITVAFTRPALGHILLDGPKYCGKLYVVDIGINACILQEVMSSFPSVIENTPLLWNGYYSSRNDVSAHKYNYGHVCVMSGEHGKTGAARLSAMASLRSGAGIVTVASPTNAMLENSCHLTAIMLREVNTRQDFKGILSDARINSIVIGPNFGIRDAVADFIEEICNTEEFILNKRSLIIDADALRFYQDRREMLFALIRGRNVVITPHTGEFIALFPDLISDVRNLYNHDTEQCNLPDIVQQAANIAGCVVVLKMAGITVIASYNQKNILLNAAINDRSAPWLATGGSGDVLAGMIAAFAAQGLPAYAAASLGVWLHNEVGTTLMEGAIADDIISGIPRALGRMLRLMYDGMSDYC